MRLKPIKTEADYDAAIARIDELWPASGAPEDGTPEADELAILGVLIDVYERELVPDVPPDPIDAIEFRMDQMGLTRKDLEPFIGSRARVSEVMNRKRGLSLAMIRRLTEGLGIPVEVLIAESKQAA